MIDEQKRQLSALRDGELDTSPTARLLNELSLDPDLRATWARYQLIGSVIRGEQLNPEHACIADRVAQALEHEPLPFIAPAGSRRKGKGKGAERASLSPMAGMALAAAAAFVTVFALPALFHDRAPVPMSLAESQPHVAPGALIAEQPPVLANASAQRWALDQPALASKLDLLLVTHQETASMTGARGMLPYATFVGYDAPR
ncbi:MAG: sigma-E factor negative regulatory protein [Chromatiaceae bacterium]|nr:sigma-E factor negative regulatory protein [Chromatiaceae bacterium]